ncbi:MAG TPA: RNB domain-containing ribonuclease [Solirubrobacteraceae bacterium]|jgi:ribonuclease R|nr:RNB domain-containing ribonuclease [Solirubrobacteraceae bacterium]
MSPPRGGSRGGPSKRAKVEGKSKRGGKAEGKGKNGKAGGARKSTKTSGARAAKSSAPSKDGSGARAPDSTRSKRVAPRLGGSSNTRVVWPPQERTETARDAIEQMMREAGHALRFDSAVEREARKAGARAWARAEVELREGERRDLRELPTFTVDPSTARDFDDAISAEALPDGTVRIWVHIADVAAHVPLGSAIDIEARRRSTSVYVPGTVEPMLPHALSSDACSLVPGAERLAVTVEMLLRGSKVLSASFCRSLIRSDMRLDYEQVDRVFVGEEVAPEPWGGPLAAARAAAAELQRARDSGGALAIDSEEPEFSFDESGNVTEILSRAQTESHRLIEHLMIAANEAVARQLAQASVPCLYRVHERPDPERIRTLVAQLASLGVSTPPLPDPLFPARAAELVGEISRRVNAHVRRSGMGRIALSSLVLRSLKQACYSPKNAGHAGLHSACYCHFTSPIRRYPDLVCHRALLSSVGAGERVTSARKLVELGEWTSQCERDAAKLEHKGDDIAACFLLEEVLLDGGYDQVFAGEVTGLIGAGAFVAFGDAPRARGGHAASRAAEEASEVQGEPRVRPIYEGMLPVRLLSTGEEREWWSLNEQSTIMRGERSGAMLRLGDPVDVRVVRVDASAGRVDLAPAG